MVYGIWILLDTYCRHFVSHLILSNCTLPLFYISAFYPLFMIGLTWVCIEMHSRNFQPFVWVWNKVKAIFIKKRETKGTVFDVFATFLLLSYTKMMQTSLYILFATYVLNINNKPPIAVVGNDHSIKYFSSKHIPSAIFAFLILLGPVLLPALLLALYPL